MNDDIFFPFATKKWNNARARKQRFVHYSSADAALINKEVWLRKASCMNDFFEIEHGRRCLEYAKQQGVRDQISSILDASIQEFPAKLKIILTNGPRFCLYRAQGRQ